MAIYDGPLYSIPKPTSRGTSEDDFIGDWQAGLDEWLGSQGYTRASNFTNGQGTFDYFNQNYGTNLGSQGDYWNYLYGGGGDTLYDSPYGSLYKTPTGTPTSQYSNTPLDYSPASWDDNAWIIPLAIASYGALSGGLAGAGTGAGTGAAASAGTEGFLGLGGAGGSGLAGGVAGYGSTLGGGMGFFDDILGDLPSGYFDDFVPGTFDGPGSAVVGDIAGILPSAGIPSGFNLSSIGNVLTSGLKSLFGGGNTGGSGGLLNFLGGGLGSAINTAPILAAINYARNQSPFDTSRLESLYSNFNPESQAFQYDTNTGLGREELTSGLARRGISGSSFGDQSLNNYNTFRDLGRSSLINQGIETQAGIAGQILNSDVASRQMKNDLYGRALLALSGGLAPRTSGALSA